MIKRTRWFSSKLKRFVVVLVLDRGYSVEQVALTARIDEDTVRRWTDKAKLEREKESRIYGDRVVPLFSPLLGDMSHYERAHGIPKNTRPEPEDEPDDDDEGDYDC